MLILGMAALSFSMLAGCTVTVKNEPKTEVGETSLVPLTDRDESTVKKVVAYEDRTVYQFDPETDTLVKDGVIEKGSSYIRPVDTGDTLLVGDENYDYVQFGNEMVLINAIESTADLRETMAKE